MHSRLCRGCTMMIYQGKINLFIYNLIRQSPKSFRMDFGVAFSIHAKTYKCSKLLVLLHFHWLSQISALVLFRGFCLSFLDKISEEFQRIQRSRVHSCKAFDWATSHFLWCQQKMETLQLQSGRYSYVFSIGLIWQTSIWSVLARNSFNGMS